TLMPLHTLYQERFALPRNESGKTIVLICSGGSASGVGYGYLQHYGFRNILRVEGGIENWQAKGLPVEGTDVL
ncbi:MAG: rhodanese-like domain-containing protein, partial [Dehalococcoidia bacterium]